MATNAFPCMVGDVGGTNARWAIQQAQDGPLCHVSSYAVKDFTSIQASIEHFLAYHACPPPRELAIGVATAVTGDQIKFTNSPWSFSSRALQADLGFKRLVVINDFEALAMSLPWLPESGRRQLGRVEVASANRHQPAFVVGPGTGIGVAALVWKGSDEPIVVSGEGGHATLAASNDVQAEILRFLREEFEHVSAERVLSGAGLVNLYRALCAIHGSRAEALSAADVVAHGVDGIDTRCVDACDLFTEFLGSVAGNLALAFGARGGVYIGGESSRGLVHPLMWSGSVMHSREKGDCARISRKYQAG